jgi:hypothetical protein
MSDCKPCSTPVDTQTKVSSDNLISWSSKC